MFLVLGKFNQVTAGRHEMVNFFHNAPSTVPSKDIRNNNDSIGSRSGIIGICTIRQCCDCANSIVVGSEVLLTIGRTARHRLDDVRVYCDE
jgi:hypothetical protein